MPDPKIYAGLMAGSSADGIDVWFGTLDPLSTLQACHFAYPKALHQQLVALLSDAVSLPDVLGAQSDLTDFFIDCLSTVADLQSATALGVHGHTVWHRREPAPYLSWQMLEPYRLAHAISMPVVYDVRSQDVVLGGQGAPLAPLFHAQRFAVKAGSLAVVNIGGIANVTRIEHGRVIAGFDCGPGNSLLDLWYQQHHDGPWDEQGLWARSGRVETELLAAFSEDAFFSRLPPKSIHRDYFNSDWLQSFTPHVLPPEDVQRTLLALTALMISRACQGVERVMLCGGGAHNDCLRESIESMVAAPVEVAEQADWLEAQLMAWLAYNRYQGIPLDYTSVTGGSQATLVGHLFEPARLVDGVSS